MKKIHYFCKEGHFTDSLISGWGGHDESGAVTVPCAVEDCPLMAFQISLETRNELARAIMGSTKTYVSPYKCPFCKSAEWRHEGDLVQYRCDDCGERFAYGEFIYMPNTRLKVDAGEPYGDPEFIEKAKAMMSEYEETVEQFVERIGLAMGLTRKTKPQCACGCYHAKGECSWSAPKRWPWQRGPWRISEGGSRNDADGEYLHLFDPSNVQIVQLSPALAQAAVEYYHAWKGLPDGVHGGRKIYALGKQIEEKIIKKSEC